MLRTARNLVRKVLAYNHLFSAQHSLPRTVAVVSCYPSHFSQSCSHLIFNKVRYQHDQLEVHRAAAILVPPYDYGTALNVQQPPLLDTTLELPNTSSDHVTFSPHFPLPPRNHLAHDFSIQPLASSRLSPSHSNGSLGYRYNASSDRRLPGGHSHDHSYARQAGNTAAMPTDDDRSPSVSSPEIKEASASTGTNSTRQARKEVSTTVIACRQWYVCFYHR